MEAIWILFAFTLGLAVRQVGLPPLIGYLAAGFSLYALDFKGGGVLEHIAHLGVVTRQFSYVNQGLTPPTDAVRVELNGPNGA